MEYEDALREYFQDVRVGYERIGGLPWTEIDFIEDVKKLNWKFCQDYEKVLAKMSDGEGPAQGIIGEQT